MAVLQRDIELKYPSTLVKEMTPEGLKILVFCGTHKYVYAADKTVETLLEDMYKIGIVEKVSSNQGILFTITTYGISVLSAHVQRTMH